MGYMHIDNLYKKQEILLFKECYAMEKIHGTSAHISWKDQRLSFFSGGVEHLSFLNLFNQDDLTSKFTQLGIDEIIVFGEAYGGKCQKMSHVYGKNLRFIAFEVKIGNSWLCVPDAEKIVISLGLDFVSYVRCSTDIEELNKQRDMPSVQAVKNGIIIPQKREGIVLRPIIELRKNNGERIISKHKGEEFSETKTPRDISSDDLQILEQAQAIADEWVTEMRLTHVLDKFPDADISKTGDIINAMIEDVERESDGEIVKSKKARAAIGKKTATLFKHRLNNLIKC